MKNLISKAYSAEFLLIISGIFCGLMQGLLDLPYIAFFCYAPMMTLLQKADGKYQFLKRFAAFFLPYYLIQLIFLVTAYDAAPINAAAAIFLLVLAVILLTLWESILMLFPLCFYFWLRHGRISDTIYLALLITAGEWLQENIFFLSFPWSGVWLSVTDSPLLLQSANLFGARFVSFLILLAAGSIGQLVTDRKRLYPAVVLSCVLAFIFVYGGISINTAKKLSEEGEKLSVLCAQDDCEGRKKSEITALEAAETYEKIIRDSGMTADLILLPETAVPCDYEDGAEEFQLLVNLSKEMDSTIVTGAFVTLDGKAYNAVMAIYGDNVSAPYCKQTLVPFGERIPLGFLFGEEDPLCECTDRERIKPISSNGMTIGCVICVESVYSSSVRQQTKQGAEFLCVSTNDSWFGKSFARNQHYRHSIMRAAENRKWLIRAGNCGISAVMTPWGEETAALSENTKGTVSGEISRITEKSLYGKTGDIFITLPTALIVIAVIRRFS